MVLIKNNDKIIDNNTSLGAAGLLPNLIISSGYNASLSNTNLEFNPFVDFGTEEIDVSQALSSSLSSSVGFNYTLFNGFNGIYTLKKFDYLDKSSKENLRFQIENKIIDVVVKYYEFLNIKQTNNVLEETYQISKDRYNRLLERYDFGSISNLELLNAEADLNTDLINLNNSSLNLKICKNNLHFLMGFSDTINTIEDKIIFNDNINLDDLKIKSALIILLF